MKSRSKIVVISDYRDAHIDFVQRHLDKQVYLLDPGAIVKGDDLSYYYGPDRKNLLVLHKGQELTDVDAVWYRKPVPYEFFDLPLDDTYREYSIDALTRHRDVLYSTFKDAFWVSSVNAVRCASVKPVQLEVASKIGFSVPETLVTSSPRQAEEFVRRHKACIAKPISVKFPKGRALLAKLVTADQKLDYRGLVLDPMIFQEFIEPAAELRITVVGDKEFAATVSGENADGVNSHFRDWRTGGFDDTFAAAKYRLSVRLKRQCIELVKSYNLQFGAIDLIVDKRGRAWFLEINPNGQWAFIEEETGQPIGKAIAELLTFGRPSK
jgi:glutathione synthase/RimK-type ligase-like ATP-grasp enzyme